MYSSKTGTSVDATLDTRLLTEKGREQIAKEYEDMDKNMKTIANTLPSATSDNPIEATIGNIWNWVAHGTLDVLPSNENNGGVLRNIPGLFGEEDSLYYVYGDKESKKLYVNGIWNFYPDNSKEGGQYIVGDESFQYAYNPSSGILGDLLETSVDKFLWWRTGVSKQAEKTQNEGDWTDIYLHSQGHEISKYNPNKNVTYYSYGAPSSVENIKEIFNIRNPENNIQQNEGDYVSYPINIFNPLTWDKPGHATSNYGASKEKKEQSLNTKDK